ncbi:hypothetical protein CQW31_02130 [Pseudomonas sp. 382]|nr:hypothetical protein CQW31_02130 [Pseudomonas sp. 382]
MVELLLFCAMPGILGGTFRATKPTFSCALNRKKLRPANTARKARSPLAEPRQNAAFAVLSASPS